MLATRIQHNMLITALRDLGFEVCPLSINGKYYFKAVKG